MVETEFQFICKNNGMQGCSELYKVLVDKAIYVCEVADIGFYYTTNYFKHWRDNNEGSMFSSLRSLPAASEWLLCL